MSVRVTAVNVILKVLNGTSLSESLPEATKLFRDTRDQAFLKSLVFNSCRWYLQLDYLIKKLLQQPLKNKDQDIQVILIIGLCQLIILDIPAHAAVTETVELATKLKKTWAKNLINAVLRNFLRQKDKLLSELPQVACYAQPNWLIKKIEQDWPENFTEILTANNQHPPMTLRVNLTKISREEYLKKLNLAPDEISINKNLSDYLPAAITLTKPINVTELPGFFDGLVSVQDQAAQLAAKLLAPNPADHILDACAAPGGKTAHLLELQPKINKLIAVDRDHTRLLRVTETLKRLNLSAKLITADVADTATWWDGQLFDRILLDAPCSASGVIRRHPDIRLLRRETDIPPLAAIQAKILAAIWPLLTIGGHLLYATCSIFRQENEEVVSNFLANEKTAAEIKIQAEWGIACPVGRQILPGQLNMDGFYYALLKKIA